MPLGGGKFMLFLLNCILALVNIITFEKIKFLGTLIDIVKECRKRHLVWYAEHCYPYQYDGSWESLMAARRHKMWALATCVVFTMAMFAIGYANEIKLVLTSILC